MFRVTAVGVSENGVAESVNGDCDGCPVGNVMLQETDVDVRDVDENGQNPDWRI